MPLFRKKTTRELKEFRKAKKLLKKLSKLRIIYLGLILLLITIITPFIIFFIYKPKVQENINYGVTFSDKYATEIGLDWKDAYIKMLDDLNVKNLRLIAYWDDIEEIKDKPNYENIIWQLEEAEKRNANVILSMGRKVPRYPECFEPRWWRQMQNEELKRLELMEHIKTTTETLKKYYVIKIWQVENEPFFKFGECDPDIKKDHVLEEIAIVRGIDDRPILVQDSGEGGFWLPAYQVGGDYLGISMYRRIWYDFWHVFFGNYIYFKYPLAYWTYKIKAGLTLVPHEKIIVTELQAEPWGPGINSELSEEDKNKTMSRHHFLDTISYAQKAGFKDLYFWGVEWWLWEKEVNDNPFYWDTAKALIN